MNDDQNNNPMQPEGAQVISISQDIQQRWQRITTLVAKLMNIPACFVVRQNQDSLEVIVGSEGDAAEQAGSIDPFGQGAYCETVVKKDEALLVHDAAEETKWLNNPDYVNDGLRGYYGLPVHWPDGSIFGTFCVFSDERLEVSKDHKELMDLLRENLEDNLKQTFLRMTVESQNSFMKMLSETDGLTGVKNREAFLNAGLEEMSRGLKLQKPFSTLVVDIDHFKAINDVYGHPAGDAVLQWVCQKISAAIRDHDVIGRLGGEEFAVHLPETDLKTAKKMAQRIVHDIAEDRCKWNKSCMELTVSVGVSQGLSGNEAISEVTQTKLGQILDQADKAMHRAKENGRNQISD